jgi:hypothetical protein
VATTPDHLEHDSASAVTAFGGEAPETPRTAPSSVFLEGDQFVEYDMSDATRADFAAIAAAPLIAPPAGVAPEVPVVPVPVRAGHARRFKARRVNRIVRHVDPWSIMKISLILHFCLWIVCMAAGAILWSVAGKAGAIGSVERFIRSSTTSTSFHLNGGAILRASALGGLLLVVIGTVLSTAGAVLFNLISDLVGGVRVTVIEEETAVRR